MVGYPSDSLASCQGRTQEFILTEAKTIPFLQYSIAESVG